MEALTGSLIAACRLMLGLLLVLSIAATNLPVAFRTAITVTTFAGWEAPVMSGLFVAATSGLTALKAQMVGALVAATKTPCRLPAACGVGLRYVNLFDTTVAAADAFHLWLVEAPWKRQPLRLHRVPVGVCACRVHGGCWQLLLPVAFLRSG